MFIFFFFYFLNLSVCQITGWNADKQHLTVKLVTVQLHAHSDEDIKKESDCGFEIQRAAIS